ncbi:hypothetical protein BKF98_RS19720 [Vibrio parahaemolyticus]|nr:hypothetical protein [Vibrio parahaemolyticus]
MTKHSDKKAGFIKIGGEIAGAAVAGALSVLADNMPGAALAGIAGVVMARTTAELADRSLSKRESIRAGGAAALAIDSIKSRLEAGEQLREDNFFEQSTQRCAGDELFEGVMLAAKNSHEEKKVKLLSNLFSNIAFDESCSKEEANALIKLTEHLTYSQLVFLKIASGSENRYKMRTGGYLVGEQVEWKTLNLLHQIKGLCERGLLIQSNPAGGDTVMVLGITDISPSYLSLNYLGVRLSSMLNVNDIEESDAEDIAKCLR